MYDQQKFLNFAMSGMDAVQCLLDFSRGPKSAVFITPVEEPACKEFCSRTETMNKTDAPTQLPIEKTQIEQISKQLTTSLPGTSSTGVESPKQPRAICNFCGKVFTHLGDYNKHRRRHTGEKPYACDLCPRTFAHASNLARHRRLHSGEKPFECTQCDKRFSRKDKLRYHMERCRVAL